MFFIIIFSIWALILTHVFYRTEQLFGGTVLTRVLIGLGVYLLGFAYVLARIFVSSSSTGTSARVLIYSGALLTGFFAILWTLIVFFDIGSVLASLAVHVQLGSWSLGARRTTVLVLWGSAAVLGVVGWVIGYSTPRLTTLRVTVPGVQPARFAVLSDSHLGEISSADQWRRTLQEARELHPDAILFPGDLIDDATGRGWAQAGELRAVFPEQPIYVSFGNHDVYSGVEHFTRLCRTFRFRLLRQESEPLVPGLAIAGIDDASLTNPGEAVRELVPQLNGPVFLMSHRPAVAHLLQDRSQTLVLSGHTHGGQTLPAVLLVALANGGFRAGNYVVGACRLYLSRGVGVWGPPVRLFASPELILIEVSPGSRFEVKNGSGR
ncbi:MAG: metallophosphoesterase [Acidobacteriota bacterium]|jgi:uncharacterized protein